MFQLQFKQEFWIWFCSEIKYILLSKKASQLNKMFRIIIDAGNVFLQISWKKIDFLSQFKLLTEILIWKL